MWVRLVDASAQVTAFLQENVGKMLHGGKARKNKGGGWTVPVMCAVAGKTQKVAEVVVSPEGELVNPPLENIMDRLSDVLSEEIPDKPAEAPAGEQEMVSSLEALLDVIEAGEDFAPGKDALTQVHSHSHFQERLSEEVERAKRYGLPFSCLLADIDNFAEFNEEHGFRLGDALLRQVAMLVSGVLRGTDFVARWGADEFAIIAQGEAKDTARAAERVRSTMEGHPFRIHEEQEPISVTVSVGGASFPSEEVSDKEALLRLTHDMLTSAKAAGGNRVMMARSVRRRSRSSKKH